jgi:DNA-directed RNA polymerase specialized sigma24 family protein
MRQPSTLNGARPRLDPTVEAALPDNRQAFLRLLTRHLGSAEAVEEVQQQFSLHAISRAFHLRRRESMRAWLSRPLSTVLADYARREATRRRQEAAYARQQALTEERRDSESTVCTCLYTLPTLQPAYADILRRVELLGASRQQLAAALGVTVHTVTVRLHWTRQALKRALLLSCTTCLEHGFLRCACDRPLRPANAAGSAPSHPP